MQRDYVPWLQGMQQYAPGSGSGTLTEQRCEQGAKEPRGEASPCRSGVWEHGPEVGHLSQSKLPLIQYTRPTPPPGTTIIPVIRRHREVKAFGIGVGGGMGAGGPTEGAA